MMQLSFGPPRRVEPPRIGHPSLAEAGTGRLTPRGKRAAAAFLARFPGGLRTLAHGAGETRANARKYSRLFGEGELETLCLYALVKAVRRWRPRDGALTTATVQSIRSELVEAFRPARMPVVRTLSPLPKLGQRSRWLDPESTGCLLSFPDRPDAEALAERPAADLDELFALARRHEGLTDREEFILRKHFGHGWKLRELAWVFDVRKERVRQIGKRALEKLKAAADRRPEPNRSR